MSFRQTLLIEGGRLRVAGLGPDAAVGLVELRAALRGGSTHLSAADAVQLLAASPFPNRHRDLAEVLADQAATSRLRYLAAVGLARAERTAAQEILLGAMGSADPLVLGGVFRSLGQLGDEAALAAIERALERADARARAQGEFARILIVHRLGLAGRVAPPAAPAETLELAADCGRRVLIRPARPHVAAQSLLSLGRHPYEIELAEAPMFEWQCNRCKGMILLNREFAGPDAVALLRKRPAIYGVGALSDRQREACSVAALLLTTPEPGGGRIAIGVYLTNGVRVFEGHAESDADRAAWQLRAVRRLGAFPIRAQGSLDAAGLRIDEAASGIRVPEKGRPELLTEARPPRAVQFRPHPTDQA